MMSGNQNEISLFDGTVIGRVEAWVNDPGIFDGWLELEGATDRLVVNGANRSWAVAEVAREYIMRFTQISQEERDGLLACDLDAWAVTETRRQRVQEANKILRASISEHYRSMGKR